MLKIPLLYLSQILSRFFRHPLVRQFGQNYPRLYTFLQNRFSFNHFTGLPLTFILILIWLNLSLLSELAESIVNSPGMKSLDGKISLAFFELRLPWLSFFFYWFSKLASYQGLLITTLLTGIFLIYKRKPYYLLGFLISVLGSGLAVKITKAFFVRERPLDIAYYPETSFSFPSGHATAGIALEGFICYLLIMEAKRPHMQFFWLAFGLLFNFLMGISRIYLGVHFATDVLAGWLLGFLWLLFGIVIMEFATIKKAETTFGGNTS